MAQFNKEYDNFDEFKLRFGLFAEKDAYIKEHNANPGHLTYTVGHNHMSDWAQWEYEQLLTYMPQPQNTYEKFSSAKKASTNADPVDWRDEGVVSPIQDQGQCGSCWAFSTIGSLESAHALVEGNSLEKFSEQQLVDCVGTCFGCNGGNVGFANRYLKSHPAILEADYPYAAVNQDCQDTMSNTGVVTQGTINVSTDDPDAMKAQLADGPISVAIQANKLCFQMYTSGIFNNDSCGGSMLDHAVMLVGWGIENSTEYWILRNSWATTWGEEGYMRLEIKDGMGYCGVNSQPQAPKNVN